MIQTYVELPIIPYDVKVKLTKYNIIPTEVYNVISKFNSSPDTKYLKMLIKY